jgi:hypothetical protein
MVSVTTNDLDNLGQKAADQGITTPVLADPPLSVSRAYEANQYGMMGTPPTATRSSWSVPAAHRAPCRLRRAAQLHDVRPGSFAARRRAPRHACDRKLIVSPVDVLLLTQARCDFCDRSQGRSSST